MHKIKTLRLFRKLKRLGRQSLSMTSASTTEIFFFKKSKVLDKKKGDIYFIAEWPQA